MEKMESVRIAGNLVEFLTGVLECSETDIVQISEAMKKHIDARKTQQPKPILIGIPSKAWLN